MKATRASFGEGLVDIGREFKNVVVLDADLSKSTQSAKFSKDFPDRFFQMGIQEANMIGVASGMAFSGKIPFLCSFGAFLTGRFDTIRVSVGYAEANVRLVGTHAGVGIGEDGTTQMALEDLACMRTIPGMAVLSPADDVETKQMLRYLVDHKGPAYIRLTRQAVPQVNGSDYKFQFGRAVQLKSGTDAVVFGTGNQAGLALEAAKKLEDDGLNVAVVNIHTIKPIDRETVSSWAKKVPYVFTAEDHNIIGGLGGAVAEVMAEVGATAKLVRIGVNDTFGESGTPEDLYKKHELDAPGIAKRIKNTL
ncbi:MAG: transketolase family protein [Bdellovibrionales bacterium]|nr:transketolase family protein [Bdellovibrionales bacterium]